jgi:hypothetical protein
VANKPILEFFPPLLRPDPVRAAGAFHHQALAGTAALPLAWTLAFALLGLAVLRKRLPRPARSPHQAGGTAITHRQPVG